PLGLGRGEPRSGPTRGTQLGGEAVLAALGRRSRGWPEGHLFLFPGGIEGGEVVWVLVRLTEKRGNDFGLRFDLGERLGAREDRRIGRLTLLQTLPDRFKHVRRVAE